MQPLDSIPSKYQFVFFLLLLSCSFSVCQGQVDYYAEILQEKKIELSAKGLNAYLKQLHPSEEQQRRIKNLIVQLGASDSFIEREDAMAKLLMIESAAQEALIEASESSDPEVRWRAKRILALGKPESDNALFAALKYIEARSYLA